jgi:hypothetical protein
MTEQPGKRDLRLIHSTPGSDGGNRFYDFLVACCCHRILGGPRRLGF